MRKESLLFGIFGLIAGLVIGFVAANNMNRSAASPTAAQSTSANAQRPNPALPPDHPPLGTSASNSSQGAPRPEVTAAIDRARAEPSNYEAQMTAADLYYQIERFEEAAKFYEAAVRLKPAEFEALKKLGDSLFDADKFEQAERWYRLALEKEPKNVNVRTDLGLTFFLREPRDTASAIREYKLALDLDSRNEIALQNLALAYNENGDADDLRATLELLKKVNPNNPAIARLQGK